ncbi:GNAT family N-acetyltransferase [Paucisalibacillus sp. EB02]|uniref:GNAT family N-acetyltransferase n=1 Tax=Paucisalibacillus sp. EB02 TaxID=1347087 RepID=UPI00069444EC|nr:GNAT family N-acetyltransferase [Paucisalibacillus sp. EB02]
MVTKNVRLATVYDAEELSRLNHEFNGGDRVDSKNIQESIKNNTEIIAVATVDERLVGFACAQVLHSFCYSNAHGEITEMYVEESARRKGFASLMIALLEENLAERGVTSIKILTGKGNEAAIRTYLRSGYVVEDDIVLDKKVSC